MREKREFGQVVVVAPVHLQGMRCIMKTFKVAKKTVRKWRKDGAPIYWVGGMYQCSYDQLLDWLGRENQENVSFQKTCQGVPAGSQ